jgi:hypothetical protein
MHAHRINKRKIIFNTGTEYKVDGSHNDWLKFTALLPETKINWGRKSKSSNIVHIAVIQNILCSVRKHVTFNM